MQARYESPGVAWDGVGVWRLERGQRDPLLTAVVDLEPGQANVALRGQLCLASAAVATEALRCAESHASLVVLDLRGLSFMDCSGLHIALDASTRMRESGGRLVVVQGPPNVRRIFEMTGVISQLEIVDEPPRGQRAPLSSAA